MSINKANKAVAEIIYVNGWLVNFWRNSSGWAPDTAAELMSKSRLDDQVSLSNTLIIWLESVSENQARGRLILAWVNLCALIEGTLKLFLCVYYEDYRVDFNAYRDQKNNLKTPDTITLEKIRVFFNKNNLWSKEWDSFVLNVQQKRNAVHAIEDRDIGTFDEFYQCTCIYLKMIREFNLGLPYPDDISLPVITSF